MPTTLYTNGAMLEMTAAEFEAYDAIRLSEADPGGLVSLYVTDGGALDLSAELGSTSARVSASISLGGTIVAGSGHDGLFGALGQDSLFGGKGDDVIYGHDGNDLLDGGEGNDRLNGMGGDDRLYGGAGNDVLDDDYTGSWTSDAGVGALFGGTGDDVFQARSGTVDGGSGRDTLMVASGDLTSLAFTSVEVLIGSDYDAPFKGTVAQFESFQSIRQSANEGWSEVHLVIEGAGSLNLADELGTGSVVIEASDLGNTIVAGQGDDRIIGGAGADTLTGAGRGDGLEGGGGDDALYGGDDHDFLAGGEGRDRLSGGAGNDQLGGGAGDDALNGGAGADFLWGEAGNDRYSVDDAGDIVDETVWDLFGGPTGQDAGGHDQVTASVSFTLGGFVEDLTLTGAALMGTGNGLANALNGSGQATPSPGSAATTASTAATAATGSWGRRGPTC